MFEFGKLFDPSTTLGAFLISLLASYFVGFFTTKAVNKFKKKNIQKSNIVYGDMNQDSFISKGYNDGK